MNTNSVAFSFFKDSLQMAPERCQTQTSIQLTAQSDHINYELRCYKRQPTQAVLRARGEGNTNAVGHPVSRMDSDGGWKLGSRPSFSDGAACQLPRLLRVLVFGRFSMKIVTADFKDWFRFLCALRLFWMPTRIPERRLSRHPGLCGSCDDRYLQEYSWNSCQDTDKWGMLSGWPYLTPL